MSDSSITRVPQPDWSALERLKADFWAERKRSLSPSDRIQIAEELRQYVKTVRPDWPTAEEREADIAHHAHVSQLLRNAAKHSARQTSRGSA